MSRNNNFENIQIFSLQIVIFFSPTHYVTDDGGWEIRKLANTTHGDSSFPMPNVHFETASANHFSST